MNGVTAVVFVVVVGGAVCNAIFMSNQTPIVQLRIKLITKVPFNTIYSLAPPPQTFEPLISYVESSKFAFKS